MVASAASATDEAKTGIIALGNANQLAVFANDQIQLLAAGYRRLTALNPYKISPLGARR